MARGSLTPLEALNDLRNCLQAYYTMESVPKVDSNLLTIEKALKILEYLKKICLEGKDKYEKNTWGWVEFDLDKYPKLKKWLKDEY